MTEQEHDRLIKALEVIGQALTDRVTLERERLNKEFQEITIEHRPADLFKAKYTRKPDEEAEDKRPINEWLQDTPINNEWPKTSPGKVSVPKK